MSVKVEIKEELIEVLGSVDESSIETNGCSFVPDFETFQKRNLSKACNDHDIRYHYIKTLRDHADLKLKEDISGCGWKWVDDLYYLGVKYLGRLFV